MRFTIPFLLIAGLFMACESSSQSTLDQAQGTKAYKPENLPDGLEQATFAGGCFWCVEAVFERVRGVDEALSGYAGGKEPNPTYKQVSYGKTTHAESVLVLYDPTVVSYNTLLEVFFATHDPTQLNRQGPDVGEQYRSAVFYHNDEQKQAVKNYIRKLEEQGAFEKPIVTKVKKAGTFYIAEDYHQDFYEHNPNQPYVVSVTRPKVKKFEKQFPELLKAKYRQEALKSKN